MNATLQVFAQGSGHASITGATQGSAEAAALAAWLRDRIDVIRVEQRKKTGVFSVDFDDGAALPGRFLRSLRDRISAIGNRIAQPDPFSIAPVHSLKGRVRLQVSALTQPQIDALAVVAAGIAGVRQTKHLPSSRTLLVHYDVEKVSEAQLLGLLSRSDAVEWGREVRKPPKIRWFGAASGTSVLFMCLMRATSYPWLAFGIAINALPPLARSLVALNDGEISVDLLDVAATFAALATGRPTTAAFVIWMVGVGDLLLDLSANKARSALSAMMQQREHDAFRVLANGGVETVPVAALQVGDRFIVRGGHSIAADGRVVAGLAEVDEKTLNGESRLLTKSEGQAVFASTIVAEGYLVVEVERSGKDTEVAKIENILNTVGSKPLTLQRDALDLAGELVLPTFGVAALAALLSGDVTRAVCVLITDFGTGIRIAVPTSAMTGMALAAREGVLVKGAQYLERLSRTDVIVFDKTGTLTNGIPEVVEVVTRCGVDAAVLMALAASAEANHTHPVATAVKAYAKLHRLEVVAPDAGSEEYAVGLGLSAHVLGHHVRLGRASWMETQQLKLSKKFKRRLKRYKRDCVSSLCVAVGDEVVGLVAYSDGTRPESTAMVRALRAGGRRRLVLLSGDSPSVVEAVARTVGIDEAYGGLLPEAKAAYVNDLRAAGYVVAMVGDGVNDAPAMAAADVGISLAGSTDVALETADVVLRDGGLSRLERAFRVGDQAMASVRQNLALIILPNAVAIGLGAAGRIQPAMAAIINNGATILAVMTGTLPLFRLRAPSEPVPVAEIVAERDVPLLVGPRELAHTLRLPAPEAATRG